MGQGGGLSLAMPLFDLLIGQKLNFRFLIEALGICHDWLMPYQTGIFVLLKQCYYCENTGTIH